MAEEAAPVMAEQQPEFADQPPVAEVAEPAAAEPEAVEAAPVDDAAAAEGGSKRGREEDGADGEEPEAKKHAGLDEQPNVRTLVVSCRRFFGRVPTSFLTALSPCC
jgi:hypothetical protein